MWAESGELWVSNYSHSLALEFTKIGAAQLLQKRKLRPHKKQKLIKPLESFISVN